MELGYFELKDIQKYFNLETEKLDIELEIKDIRDEFYNQSMTTRTIFTEQGIEVEGFNYEKRVSKLVDVIARLENRLKDIKKRQRYFNDYLNSLSEDERDYLFKKYTKDYIPVSVRQADINAYEEIQEIEEAINSMNGIPPEPKLTLAVDNDNLEDGFNDMAKVLGV